MHRVIITIIKSMEVIAQIFDGIIVIFPFFIPIALIWLFWKMFVEANRDAFKARIEYVLLEITPPQNVDKSPAAMEVFLMALHQTGGETTWYDRYFLGKVRAWFSLEMVSIGGDVRFYIQTRKGFRRIIESQLYSQFPGIEVHEAEDYTLGIEYDGSIELFGQEWKLTEADALPIKTYVDYGLDKETEEEYKVDPITPVIETLASVTPGHQMWFQIIVRAHKKEDKKPGTWNQKQDNWKEGGKEAIAKIKESAQVSVKDDDGSRKKIALTKAQDAKILAIERSLSKISFDVGLRTMYVAEKSVYDSSYIGAVKGAFKQFNSPDLNSLGGAWSTGFFDYPWQDVRGKKTLELKKEILEAYKERDYFWKEKIKYSGWFFFSTILGKSYVDREHFVLNTEELATIFHFPGKVASTPSFNRVESKKVTPPSNLPV